MDNFQTAIPPDKLNVLLEFGNEFKFDPLGSIGMERYFLTQLQHFADGKLAFKDWIRPIIESHFRFVTMPPEWIQNPDWQVSDNGPMIFIGQIDLPPTSGLFHDESSFYVFFDPHTGERKTVMQIA